MRAVRRVKKDERRMGLFLGNGVAPAAGAGRRSSLPGARRVGGIASQPLDFLGVPGIYGPPRLHRSSPRGTGERAKKAGWDPRGGDHNGVAPVAGSGRSACAGHAASAASRTSRWTSWVLRTSASPPRLHRSRQGDVGAGHLGRIRVAAYSGGSAAAREGVWELEDVTKDVTGLVGWLLGARGANADVPAPCAPPAAPRPAPV